MAGGGETMNFDFSEDQKLLQKTARDYLVEHCGLDVCRSVLETSGTHSDALWKGVAEMGWLGAAVPESYGGAGVTPPRAARGWFWLPEALLGLGGDGQKKKYLRRLVWGELIGTFALSERAGRSGI